MGIFDSLKKKAKEKKTGKVENLIQKRLDTRRNIENLKTSGNFKVDKMEDLLDSYEMINEDLLDYLYDEKDNLDPALLNKLKALKKEIKEDKKYISEMRKFLETNAGKEEDADEEDDDADEDYLEALQSEKEELNEQWGNIGEEIGSIKDSLKKSHAELKDSFDTEEGKLKSVASAFGFSWETRKEREIRHEKEEKERLERIKKAEEEARRKAEQEAYLNKVKNNPSEFKDVIRNFSFTLFIYGDYTIEGAQRYFTDMFPYLNLGFYLVKTGDYADKHGGTIYPIDSDSQFSSIRAFKGDCDIKISGNDTPAQIESRFRRESGLVVKLGYKDAADNRFYISKDNYLYNKSLADISAEFHLKGYNKADIS